MSEKVYPYIVVGSKSGTVILIFKPSNGITIHSKSWATEDNKLETSVDEYFFKNITREYLANTWGVVESPEHAEFIKELAVNGSINASKDKDEEYSSENCFFCFTVDCNNDLFLVFCDEETAKDNDEKQITIPMPPKSEYVLDWLQAGMSLNTKVKLSLAYQKV